jgi:hypothetical protein
MNMFDDLYKDQIMLHSSSNWTAGIIRDIHSALTQQGWYRLSTNRQDFSKYTKDNKTLIVNLTHTPNETCDYYIGDAVTPWQDFKLYPEVFGVYAHDFIYQKHQPTKVFNCFINRGCATRQSWFYLMARSNLLSQGHVSFWCENRFNKTSPQQYSEQLFQTYNKHLFEQEHNQLRDEIPYKNFDISIEDAVLDSSKSLVIETFFEPNEYICYTEKTWRAIQLPVPMLLFSAQYAIENLRNWGFDVFDNVVDHSYDTEPNYHTRQQMILQQLGTPIEYNPTEFEQKAIHNRNLLKTYQQQWPQKYKKILSDIGAISNNESFTSRTCNKAIPATNGDK